MSSLPEGFFLSGLDAIVAMIMYPDILARDSKTPALNITAFVFRSIMGDDAFAYFKAGEGGLNFLLSPDAEFPYGHFSNGLLFVK